MIKIAHLGDVHVEAGARLADQAETLSRVAAAVEQRRPDLILIPGDLTGTKVPHRSNPPERSVLFPWVQRLANVAPVDIVVGNHDTFEDVQLLERMEALHPIRVRDRAGHDLIQTPAGLVSLRWLAYPTTAWLLAGREGVSAEDARNLAGEAIGRLLDTWRMQIAADRNRRDIVAHVVAGHLMVGGSRLAGGEVLATSEIEIPPSRLSELGADYVALNHIHHAQDVAPGVRYAGSLTRTSFGDTSAAKTWDLITIGAGSKVEHVPTGARLFATFDYEWRAGSLTMVKTKPHGAEHMDLTGAEVKIRLRVPADEEEQAAAKWALHIEKMKALGPHRLVVEVDRVPVNRVRAPELAEARTLPERLAVLWGTWDAPPSEDLQRAAIDRLDALGEHGTEDDAGGYGRPLSLRLEGITRYDSLSVDLRRVAPGLVAVVGGNGAGKSTLLECLTTVPLFGSFATYAGSLYDSADAQRRDCLVEAEIEVGGDTIRHMIQIDPQAAGGSGSTVWNLYQNGTPISERRRADYKESIARLYPSESMIKAAAFTAQDKGGDWLSLDKAKRRDLFAELLGLGAMQAKAAAAKAKREEHEAVLREARTTLEALDGIGEAPDPSEVEAAREAVERSSAALSAAQEAYVAARAALRDLEAEKTRAAREREAWRARKGMLESRLGERAAAVDAATDALSAFPAEWFKLEGLHLSVREAVLSEADELVTSAERQRAINEAAYADRARRERAVADARLAVQRLEPGEAPPAVEDREAPEGWQGRDHAMAAKAAASSALDSARVELERLRVLRGRDLPCVALTSGPDLSGCPARARARSLEDEITQAVERIDERERALAVATALVEHAEHDNRAKTRRAWEVRREEWERATERLTRAEAELGDALVLPDDGLDRARAHRDGLAKAAQLATALANAKASHAEAAAELDAHDQSYDDLPKPPASEALVEAEQGVAGAARAGREAREEDDATRTLLADLQARARAAEAAEAKRTAAREQEAAAAAEVSAYALLERSLGRDGLQALEIDQSGPEVSDVINELMSAVYGERFRAQLVTTAPNRKGDRMIEVFDLYITDNARGTSPRPANRYSPGERVIIGECFRLALAVVRGRRSSGKIETLFRDEADGALEEGLALRYPALLRKAADLGGYRWIYFISHREDVWRQADTVIMVADGQVEIGGAS